MTSKIKSNMALIKVFDVISAGKVVESVYESETTTSSLLKKHKKKPMLKIVTRFESPEKIVVGGGCEGGNCPVKTVDAPHKREVTSAPIVEGVDNPIAK